MVFISNYVARISFDGQGDGRQRVAVRFRFELLQASVSFRASFHSISCECLILYVMDAAVGLMIS